MDAKKAEKPENQEINEMIRNLQEILIVLQKAQKAALRKEWFQGVSGNTLPIPNIGAKTLYVDNTANANIITLTLGGDLGVWQVPASGTRYIPCEGQTQVSIAGIGSCKILAINRDLFFGS